MTLLNGGSLSSKSDNSEIKITAILTIPMVPTLFMATDADDDGFRGGSGL